jgi:outer membrane protein
MLMKYRALRHYFLITCSTAFFCLLSSRAFSDPPDMSPVLFNAAGINSDDVARASGKNKVNLFDLYTLSVSRTERMAIEEENSVQAKAHRNEAFGLFLPHLNFSATKAYPDPTSKDPFPPRTTVAFYGQQNIITGLKEISQYRKAGAEMEMRKYTLQNSAGQLLFDVATSFSNVIRTVKSLKNREKILEDYQGIATELEKRVAVGRSRPSELLQIKSQIYSLTAQIESLQNNLRQTRTDLSVLTGVQTTAEIDDELTIPEPSYLDREPGSFLGGRNDVKAAQSQVDMAKANLIAAAGGFAPNLAISGGERIYQKNMSGPDYFFELSATMPLFDGGTTVATIQEARSLVTQSELSLSQLQREAVQQISDSMTNYLSTQHQIESYRKALEQAEENYRSISDEYKLQLVTLIDVFTAVTTLANARDQYEGIVIDHQLSRLVLGIATGELVGAGVDTLRSASAGVSRGGTP